MLLALPGDDVTPEQFVAFWCDGSTGLYIHPNIWPGAVVPLDDHAELLDRQGRVHARVEAAALCSARSLPALTQILCRRAASNRSAAQVLVGGAPTDAAGVNRLPTQALLHGVREDSTSISGDFP